MRLLLDTHVLLWWLANDPSLKEDIGSAIADPASERCPDITKIPSTGCWLPKQRPKS
ncbi:MAG: hypothetical protein ACRDKZ_03450 [Actinomycetota bacterium]